MTAHNSYFQTKYFDKSLYGILDVLKNQGIDSSMVNLSEVHLVWSIQVNDCRPSETILRVEHEARHFDFLANRDLLREFFEVFLAFGAFEDSLDVSFINLLVKVDSHDALASCHQFLKHFGSGHLLF